MADLPKHFASFEILEELGRGTTGIVFKARDATHNRIVAVKTIAPKPGADWNVQLDRFVREARITAGCWHTNIVQMYAVGEELGHPYCVREFVNGCTLREHVLEQSPSSRDVLTIVEVLSRAVDHVHRQGILHRNLNPDNILIARDGTPKLIGFGRARIFVSPAQPTPETPATDIYSIGRLLGACLTRCFSPPVDFTSLPADVVAVLIRCCQFDAAARYQTSADLARALRRLDSFKHSP